jgi:aldehyde:ferredoxin oxidoreductase
MALGLAVSPRGACHNRSGAYEADFSGEVDRFRADAGRGALVAASEDHAAVLDSLIICKFLRKCFTDFYAEGAELLNKVTGWDFSASELRLAGERIQILKRLFNQREGWRPEDDWLPPRLLSEALPTGVAQGVALTATELKEMIRGYYEARELDEKGFVTEGKLRKLKVLKPTAAEMKSCQVTKHAGY